jgi:hypothetical protein
MTLTCSFEGCQAEATVRHRAFGDLPFCEEHSKIVEEERQLALSKSTKHLKEKRGKA